MKARIEARWKNAGSALTFQKHVFINIVGGECLQHHAVRMDLKNFAGLNMPKFAKARIVKLPVHFPEIRRGLKDVGARDDGEICLRGR